MTRQAANGITRTPRQPARSAFLYSRGAVSRDVDAAAATLAVTPELPRAIITHRFPLDAAAEAFATAASRASGAIKVVLEP